MPASPQIPLVGSAAIEDLVGRPAYLRGMKYAVDDRVDAIEWDPVTRTVTALVRGSTYPPYFTGVALGGIGGRAARVVDSWCSCPIGAECKHVAALLITCDLAQPPEPEPADTNLAWRTAFAPMLRAQSTNRVLLGLEFTLLPPHRHAGRAQQPRLGLRPVIPGRRDRWIHTGVSWTMLAAMPGVDVEQSTALRTILALFWGSSGVGYAPDWIDVGAIAEPLIWQAFDAARKAGVALVTDNAVQSPVEIAPSAAIELDASQLDGALRLVPRGTVGDHVLVPGSFALIGRPTHGVAAWDIGPDGKPTGIVLGPLAATPPPGIVDLLVAGSSVDVPAQDVPAFVVDVLPALAISSAIVSRDGSYEVPAPPEPRLELTVEYRDASAIDVSWAWHYAVAGQPESASRRPLGEHVGAGYRDTRGERRILDRVAAAVDGWHSLVAMSGSARQLLPASFTGVELIEFVRDLLPRLRATDGVLVHDVGPVPDYAESESEPQISISTTTQADNGDWFDLSVDVRIDGQEVPFTDLFRALASEQEYLMLPSGTYFTLDRPHLHALRTLIEEARTLVERETSGLRVSRYHADLWQELAELGVVDSQAEQWRAAVSGLVGEPPPRPVPATVAATLRSYQETGFAWLSFLHDHRLGGILADDMGLGKTLQVIATITDRAETADGPYLVVAPTSVMGNWVSECARFAPSLRAAVVAETSARRERALSEVIADADIVVTSYTLFRLDFDLFAEQQWAGLILDEAQFVKNHQAQAHSCARRLAAPVKFAITGTPLENNLMELWSLLSIVAPGLFPSPRRFAEYYQRPIEKEGDDARLAQLRRRIAPFMLRRTKDEVERDLPPKQEQVIEVELLPAHRKVYQTHLQRERQKVLGLLDDVNTNRFEIFRSLTMLRQLALDASLVDSDYSRIPSTKLNLLMELLDDAVAEGHRTLVFSQFTSFLARARSRLDSAGISYAYLDGATKRRAQVIDGFRNGTDPVFLISLKAGGFGLTLTEADYVILLDPWWNPASEAQAVDRAHRIGQDKSVMVYRFVARDTIEEKVMALKAGKAALFDAVVGGATARSGGLTADDIRELLS